MKSLFFNRINEIINLVSNLADPNIEQSLERAVTEITKALRKNDPLLICGNGGSASDSMHIAGELVGRFLQERRAYNVIALASNPSVLTAWANDYEYESVFARQVQAYGRTGGILMGISTSGRSKNVLLAAKEAKNLGMSTVLLTGSTSNNDHLLWDIVLSVPSSITPRIQEMHLILYHFLCEKIELELQKNN